MSIQHGLEINVLEQLNENLVQEIAPQVEATTDPEDDIPLALDGVFCPRVYHTLPPVGRTLVTLGNARNPRRRLPRHQIVIQNNHTTHERIGQSSIPIPHVANNGGMACTEQAEGSSCGNRRANQSNPSILPFLDTYIPGGSSCTPLLSMH